MWGKTFGWKDAVKLSVTTVLWQNFTNTDSVMFKGWILHPTSTGAYLDIFRWGTFCGFNKYMVGGTSCSSLPARTAGCFGGWNLVNITAINYISNLCPRLFLMIYSKNPSFSTPHGEQRERCSGHGKHSRNRFVDGVRSTLRLFSECFIPF